MSQLAFRVSGEEESQDVAETSHAKGPETNTVDRDGIPHCWYPRVAFLPINAAQAQRLSAAAAAEREGTATKRTVTCKGCGEKGHNMRTCPAPKEK